MSERWHRFLENVGFYLMSGAMYCLQCQYEEAYWNLMGRR